MASDATGKATGGASWRALGWAAAGLVLLAPLVAMQFTDEVDWDAGDFLAAAFLLTFAGLGWEVANRIGRERRWRLALGLAATAVPLLVWAELAVGLFD